jgi:type IV pilus assembly protein PilX
MCKRPRAFVGARKERGIVLFVALIFLLILSLLGVTAARMQTSEERMARNDDNRQLGAQAAEAALRNAESGLLSGLFTNFAANTNGLYDPTWSNGSPVPTLNWSSASAVLTYAGPGLTSIPSASQSPKFVIESLPSIAAAGDDISVTSMSAPTPPVTVYRVTAQGVGADGTSTTTLQSIVR